MTSPGAFISQLWDQDIARKIGSSGDDVRPEIDGPLSDPTPLYAHAKIYEGQNAGLAFHHCTAVCSEAQLELFPVVGSFLSCFVPFSMHTQSDPGDDPGR